MKKLLLILLALSFTVSAAKHKAKTNAGVSSYDLYQDASNIYLLSAHPSEGTTQLRLKHSTDHGLSWKPEIIIDTGAYPPRNPHFGNDIQVAASKQNIIVIWQVSGSGFMGSGPMRYSYSHDAGITWHLGTSPADTASTDSESFVDIAADSSGVFHLTWLDTRNKKRGLRYSSSNNAGLSWSQNTTIDELTCQCCWNTLICSGNKVHILYRDESPRDMALATLSDDRWQIKSRLGGFNWQFNGCPHVGGSLCVDSAQGIHLTAWNAKTENNGLYYIHPKGTKKCLGSASTCRNSAIAYHKLGKLILCWDFVSKDKQVIMMMESLDQGLTWSDPSQISPSNVNAHHPKITLNSKGYEIFWVESLNKKIE